MPKKYPLHKCENEVCNTVTVRKRFCSHACEFEFKRSHESKVSFVCEQCGKPFKLNRAYYIAAYERRGIKRRFCSNECKAKWFIEHPREYHRIELVDSVCIQCGNTFPVKSYNKAHNTGKFCSDACYRESRKKDKIITVCPTCGKQNERNASRVKQGWGIYCNVVCYGAALSIAMEGENHPNWNGGSSYIEYPTSFTPRLKRVIKELHQHKCGNPECNKPEYMNIKECGYKLAIHHIDYDKQNSNPENLIPLCSTCHAKTNYDREYWKEYYTKIKQGFSYTSIISSSATGTTPRT